MAIKLALKYNGEIISADSRTVYKGLDIGTAKPSRGQRAQIMHHGLDLINPGKRYSAGQFKKYAQNKIKEIHRKNKIVFIVGGSGLYIDALVYDYKFADKNSKRDSTNPRHLSRDVQTHKKQKPKNVLYLGIKTDRQALIKRIDTRAKAMLENGLIEEAVKNIEQFGNGAPGLQAPGYKALEKYIGNEISAEDALKKFIQFDSQLAKRQMTWLKRNQDIYWVQSFEQANKRVSNFLLNNATMNT
jgi:tRNA dimethylallyltransferase